MNDCINDQLQRKGLATPCSFCISKHPLESLRKQKSAPACLPAVDLKRSCSGELNRQKRNWISFSLAETPKKEKLLCFPPYVGLLLQEIRQQFDLSDF